jgi:hypothetical protein
VPRDSSNGTRAFCEGFRLRAGVARGPSTSVGMTDDETPVVTAICDTGHQGQAYEGGGWAVFLVLTCIWHQLMPVYIQGSNLPALRVKRWIKRSSQDIRETCLDQRLR